MVIQSAGVRGTAVAIVVALVATGSSLAGQDPTAFDRADTLRGSIGEERAWWDVTFYDLHVAIEPADSTISGRNGIVYRVLSPGTTMQIDLQQPLVVDSVVRGGRRLDHRREGDVVWVETPESALGSIDTVTVHYHGQPRVAPRAPWDGGFVWARDDRGEHWIATANQELGASVWWPNKDTQADEPDSQRIAITVPEPLVNVSNGRLRSVDVRGDGTATWEWFVASPINNYGVAINAGDYAHFGGVYQGELGPLTLDYWPLSHNFEAALEHFEEVPAVLGCFEHWFGPFPWYEDGFTMVETPYLGMEHQSGIAYGNRYLKGYLGRDLSQTGLGLEWDYITVHEAAHEWWGNSITTADIADMWVHESFGAYAESLFVECLHDPEAGARYVRGTRRVIGNQAPILGTYGVNARGSGDMYSKGANMLHTIRQVVDDDDHWRSILRGLQSTFRHSIVTGDEVRSYVDDRAEADLAPVFRQYLETTAVPVLELRAGEDGLEARWRNVVDGFAMPIDLRPAADEPCVRIHPSTEWRSTGLELRPEDVRADRDYYVGVLRRGLARPAPPEGVCAE